MPRTTNGRLKSARQYWLRPLVARKRAPWHWFDHPEVQAGIAEAEADFRGGRYQSGTSVEELMRQLDMLKK